MSSQGRKGKPRCPVCRSKRWHRDSLSGSIVCEEGHLLSGYVQESTETQEASQYTLTTRHTRKIRVKRVKPPRNDFFHGDRAAFLLWQSLQLLLRLQLRAMIDELGFPEELEVVCRDLWALLMASSGVAATPKDHANGTEDPSSYSGHREGAFFKGKRKKRRKLDGNGAELADDEESSEGEESDQDDGAGKDRRRRQRRDSFDSDADDESASSEEEPSVVRDSDFDKPNRSEGEADDDSVAPNLYAVPRRKRPPHKHRSRDPRFRPRLSFLLLIIYLGCVSLRLPVMLKDIFDLAETYQIPYLGAKSLLLNSMAEHMSSDLTQLFIGAVVPRVGQEAKTRGIQYWLYRFTRMYKDDWGIKFPEINVPLLSWRLHRQLACSPLLYLLTSRLLALLPPRFSFDIPVDPVTTLSNERSHAGRPRVFASAPSGYSPGDDLIPPEIQIVAGIVIAARLAYGIGSPEEDVQEELGLPKSEAWLDTLDAIAQLEDPRNPAKLWNKDVALMEDSDIDAYLSFFEDHLTPSHIVLKNIDAKDLESHFPRPGASQTASSPSSTPSHSDELNRLITQLYDTPPPPTSAPSESPPPSSPPGKHYISYTSVLSFPTALSRLVSHASTLVGLTSSELLVYIIKMENRLANRDDRSQARESKLELLALTKKAVQEKRAEWKDEVKRRSQIVTLAGKNRIVLKRRGASSAESSDGGSRSRGSSRARSVASENGDEFGRRKGRPKTTRKKFSEAPIESNLSKEFIDSDDDDE